VGKPDLYGEWVLRKIQEDTPANATPLPPALITAARATWPRVVAHAVREGQHEGSIQESEALAADIWETVLRSVSKALQRKGESASSVVDLESYLAAAFYHRFHRFLKSEQKRRELFEPVPEGLSLESIEAAQDTDWVSELERRITIKQIMVHMDGWTRKVWQARQYGYSWKEISVWSGLSEQAAKKRFEYGLEKTRRNVVRLLKTGKPKKVE
jgi:DNA-directed RNA polymerase specialized sigma24 family protein